jgi:hypothetical protein
MSIIQFYSQENDANNRFLQTYHDIQAYSRQVLYDCQPITKYFHVNHKNSSELRLPESMPLSQSRTVIPGGIPPGSPQGLRIGGFPPNQFPMNQPSSISGIHPPPLVNSPPFIPGRNSMESLKNSKINDLRDSRFNYHQGVAVSSLGPPPPHLMAAKALNNIVLATTNPPIPLTSSITGPPHAFNNLPRPVSPVQMITNQDSMNMSKIISATIPFPPMNQQGSMVQSINIRRSDEYSPPGLQPAGKIIRTEARETFNPLGVRPLAP